MLNSTSLEELAKNLYEALPEKLKYIEQDVQNQFKDILKIAFSKMDLVTREEFDVQAKVLLRTREKVDALQAKLDRFLQQHPTE